MVNEDRTTTSQHNTVNHQCNINSYSISGNTITPFLHGFSSLHFAERKNGALSLLVVVGGEILISVDAPLIARIFDANFMF
jgi:hypothetical protein